MSNRLVVTVPPTTRLVIDSLKLKFNVTTDAEVFSRAIYLANTAFDVVGDDKVVTLSGSDDLPSIVVNLGE